MRRAKIPQTPQEIRNYSELKRYIENQNISHTDAGSFLRLLNDSRYNGDKTFTFTSSHCYYTRPRLRQLSLSGVISLLTPEEQTPYFDESFHKFKWTLTDRIGTGILEKIIQLKIKSEKEFWDNLDPKVKHLMEKPFWGH